jgi:hypothetical protein
MLIDKLSEASGDFFKIYHKLLIIRKDINFNCEKGDDCECVMDTEEQEDDD